MGLCCRFNWNKKLRERILRRRICRIYLKSSKTVRLTTWSTTMSNYQDGQQNIQPKQIYIRQKPSDPNRKEAGGVRIHNATNGNSYEVKGVISQPIRKIAIVNKNSSNNYQNSGTRIVSSSGSGRSIQTQPVYATLNTVKSGNENQPVQIRQSSGP